MTEFPASIEAHLKESGFSATEILILKKLMEEDALTLRELASKTGKSTGVLDQAMKKLLRRNIITKEWVNDTNKYVLGSLQAIKRWMDEDLRQRREQLQRKYQNFETFISSVETDKKRPDIQYFEGEEGLKQAYTQLLGLGQEMLHYFPVICAVEDDPLRDFRVQFFRERRKRGIFARYIAHNTPLGRRFQSRDVFEYRQTLLIPEEQLPFSFEKVIAGNTVACFNHIEKRACLISYPELAATEKNMFESVWGKRELERTHSEVDTERSVVPLSTKTLSGLREFFLSRKSLVAFGVLAVVSGLLTFSIFQYTQHLNLQRIRERAMAIASTAALQFASDDLSQLRTATDIDKPLYAEVIRKLNLIRSQNPSVRYAYIFRPTEKKDTFEFVADADSLHPFVEKDLNGDGRIDDADHLSPPGELYEDPSGFIHESINGPFADPKPTQDQWGNYIGGLAPIRDASNNLIGILGVDTDASDVQELTARSVNIVAYFLVIFLLFVLIRLAAFNKSLLRELWNVFKMRKVLVAAAFCAEVAFFVTLGLYFYTLHITKEELGEKLMAIAATAASQFDPADLDQLHILRDMNTDAYQRVFTKMNEIRDSNSDVAIKWVYIFRPGYEVAKWEFLADADTNVDIPYWQDFNSDGLQTKDELGVPPGTYIDIESPIWYKSSEQLLSKPFVDEIYTDPWGTFLSAYAPINDRAGKGVALLGIDMELSEVLRLHKQRFAIPLWFLGFFVLLVFVRFMYIKTK